MVPLTELWLPILLSAVVVFVLSSVIHMFLGYHAGDYVAVPAEDEAMTALGRLSIPAGDYVVPHAGSMAAMKDPAYIEKRNRGPVLVMTVFPAGQTGMGGQLLTWFLYSIVVSVFVAYIAGRALGPLGSMGPTGEPVQYLDVFRFAGTTAFVAYVVADWPQSIWWRRKWSTTVKNTFDGLLYALATAGVFGWLWPM